MEKKLNCPGKTPQREPYIACLSQYPQAGTDCCAGGDHIVQQKDMTPVYLPGIT